MPTLKKKYKIIEKTSFSPNSNVYRGLDTESQEPVAIKEITFKPYLLDSEIHSLKKLNHPYIVRLLDYFQKDNLFYIITEWFEGSPINTFSFSTEEWIGIFIKVLEGIQYIHENGIIHRDIKPQNILASPAKSPKIIDFGLSIFQDDMSLNESKVIGTLPYISPEQTGYIKAPIDVRSDIYSLGVLFYECLAGHNPFHAKIKSQIIHKHLSLVPPALSELLPHDKFIDQLNDIIQKMLSKEPDKRYPNAASIIETLSQLLADSQFPKLDDPSLFIRHDLLQTLFDKLHFYIGEKSFFLLIRGKFGSGKTFLIHRALSYLQSETKTLEMKVVNQYPFAFARDLLRSLGKPVENTDLLDELEVPLLFIKNIQRMDEPSWNLLLKNNKIRLIGTYDEDEPFPLRSSSAIPIEEITIPPYTKDQIKQYLQKAFKYNLSLRAQHLNRLYNFCQGNLEILIYLLKLCYKSHVLCFEKEHWTFHSLDHLFASIDDSSVLNYRFSEFPPDFTAFATKISLYGFSFDIHNIEAVASELELDPASLNSYLEKALELSILEKNAYDYSFINKKVHSYFYQLTPKKERITAHLKIARTLEKQTDLETRFLPLFFHYSKTNDFLKAYSWGMKLLHLLIDQYSYTHAIEVFEQLIQFFYQIPHKQESDHLDFYAVVSKMAKIYIFKGNYNQIIHILKDQLDYFENFKNPEILSQIFLDLGRLFAIKGELKNSRNWYEKAIQISESLDKPLMLKGIHENISMNYIFSGQFREAISHFEKSLTTSPGAKSDEQGNMTLIGINAFAYASIGKYERALQLLDELQVRIDNEKNPYWQFTGLHYKILVLSHIGKINDLNEQDLEIYLNTVNQQNNQLLQYSFYFSIGYYYYKKKKLNKSFEYISKSLEIRESLAIEAGIAISYLVLAEISIKLKKNSLARNLLRKIIRIIKSNHDYFSYQWYLRLKAILLSSSLDIDRLKLSRIINKALTFSKKLRLKPEIARNYYYYSLICFNIGDLEKGFFLERKSFELFRQVGMKWEEFQLKNLVVEHSIQSSRQFFGERVKLEALSKISLLLSQQKNSEELFLGIMKSAIEISGSTRGALFLMNQNRPFQVYASGINEKFDVPDTVLEFLIKNQEPYTGSTPEKKSYLFLPILFQNTILGFIYLENELIKNIFNQEQIQVMNILSSIFGVLIDNAKAYTALKEEKKNLERKVEERTKEVYLRNEIIEKDLQATRVFQRNLMPTEMPAFEGIKGDFFYKPVEEVGGDFFDFIKIDADRMLFVIADSSGHGIRASLITAMLKTILYTYPDQNFSSIKFLIEYINESLFGQISDKYIVCLLGIIDTRKHTIEMIGGGNIVVFHYSAPNKNWNRIDIKGHMLGIIPTNILKCSESKINLQEGDKLFLATDGIIEQYIRDEEGDRIIFGEERLLSTLNEFTDSKNLLKDIVTTVRNFSGDEFLDDITAISFWRPYEKNL